MDTIAIPAVKRPGVVYTPMVLTNAVLRDGWRILTHTDTYTQPKAPHALLRAALFDYLFTQESEILTLPLYLYLSPDMQYWLCTHPIQECDGQLYYTQKRPIAIVSNIRGREEYFPGGLPECVSNRDVLLLGPAA